MIIKSYSYSAIVTLYRHRFQKSRKTTTLKIANQSQILSRPKAKSVPRQVQIGCPHLTRIVLHRAKTV